MARDCFSTVTVGDPAAAQRIEQTLAQTHLTNEKQRRMDAIAVMATDYEQRDPVYQYRRQARQFIKKHGAAFDAVRMYKTIAAQMLRSDFYSQERIEQALKFGSPQVVSMTGSGQSDYARQTIQKSWQCRR